VNNKQIKAITKEANKKFKKLYPVCGDDHFNETDVNFLLDVVWGRFLRITKDATKR